MLNFKQFELKIEKKYITPLHLFNREEYTTRAKLSLHGEVLIKSATNKLGIRNDSEIQMLIVYNDDV